MNYQRLVDQQNRISEQMRRMFSASERENRNFNESEKSIWDNLLREFEANEERLGKWPVQEGFPDLGLESTSPRMSSGAYAKGLYDVKTGEAIRAWDRSTPANVMRERLDAEHVDICRDLTFGHFLRAVQFGPRSDAEKRALSIGTPTAGGYTVPAPLMVEFIDNLRNAAVVLAAGGVIVPMTSKTLDIARLDTDPAPSWRSEAGEVSQSDAVFSQVQLDAQDLAVEVVTSRELAQDSTNLEAILMRSFIQTFAVELDRVALVGSGSAPEPEGLLNATGVTEVDLGGATMTRYQSLVALRRDVQKANASPSGWIMNNTTMSELAGLEASDNQPLQPPKYFSELELFATEGVPDDEGIGSDESPVFLGNWSDLLIGIREDTTIQLNPSLRAGNGQVSWFVHLRADIQLSRPASFGRIIGNTGVV